MVEVLTFVMLFLVFFCSVGILHKILIVKNDQKTIYYLFKVVYYYQKLHSRVIRFTNQQYVEKI